MKSTFIGSKKDMEPLAISMEDMKRANEIKKFAMENIIPERDLSLMVAGIIAPVGFDKNFRMETNGYIIVVSCENQPSGVCFHFSFSKDQSAIELQEAKLLLQLFDIYGLPLDVELTTDAQVRGPFFMWIEQVDTTGTALNICVF